MNRLAVLVLGLTSVADGAWGARQAGFFKAVDACMTKAVTTLDMTDGNAAELNIRNTALIFAYAKALSRAGEAAGPFRAADRAWIADRDADCGVYQTRAQFGSLGRVAAGRVPDPANARARARRLRHGSVSAALTVA